MTEVEDVMAVITESAFRRLCSVLSGALLLGLAWTGIAGGIHQLSQPLTFGQSVQTAAQAVYGLFALLCVVTVFMGARGAGWCNGGG